MSGSRKRRTTLELGHDAFLDIVANLVGILIILVVVLGTQSKQVIDEIHHAETQEPRASEPQLASLGRLTARAGPPKPTPTGSSSEFATTNSGFSSGGSSEQ